MCCSWPIQSIYNIWNVSFLLGNRGENSIYNNQNEADHRCCGRYVCRSNDKLAKWRDDEGDDIRAFKSIQIRVNRSQFYCCAVYQWPMWHRHRPTNAHRNCAHKTTSRCAVRRTANKWHSEIRAFWICTIARKKPVRTESLPQSPDSDGQIIEICCFSLSRTEFTKVGDGECANKAPVRLA